VKRKFQKGDLVRFKNHDQYDFYRNKTFVVLGLKHDLILLTNGLHERPAYNSSDNFDLVRSVNKGKLW
jgi:hypothetical protein